MWADSGSRPIQTNPALPISRRWRRSPEILYTKIRCEKDGYLHHHSINNHIANKWNIPGAYNPSPGRIMGISCLLESSFLHRAAAAQSRQRKAEESAHQIPKISCRGFGFWVSQCEQQTGEKSHTHPMSIPGCSAQRVRDHREIKTEIIYGFFSLFSARYWVSGCTAREHGVTQQSPGTAEPLS